MSKVYSDQIVKAQSLVYGLKRNLELLKSKGINKEFISKLEADNNLALSYDEENEKIKADLRAKARRANAKLNEIKAQVKAAKKIIKNDFDKSKWEQFGIADKR